MTQGNSSMTQAPVDDRDEFTPPFRDRVLGFLGAVWQVAFRILRIPADFLFVVVHLFFVNITKALAARNPARQGCQCSIGEEPHPYCGVSYLYAFPILFRLVCGRIDYRKRFLTGHCRCTAELGVTPVCLIRSVCTLLALGVVLSGGVWGGRRYAVPLARKLMGGSRTSYDDQTILKYAADGRKYFEEGRYDEAKASLWWVAIARPDDLDSLVLLGRTFEKLDNHQDAVRCYSHAARKDPTLSFALSRLAWYHFLSDHKAEAEENARKCLSQDKDDALSHAVLAEYEFERKRADAARTHADAALRTDPAQPLALYVRGKLLAADGKAEDAEGVLSKLTSDKFVGTSAAICLARIYVTRKDFRKAEETLQAAGERGSSFQPHLELAALYYRFRRPQEFRVQCDKLIRLAQGNQSSVEQVATLLYGFGLYDQALNYAVINLERYPRSVPLRLTAAGIYFQLGMFTEMERHCEAALAVDEANVDAHLFLGRADVLRDDPAKAEAHFRRATAASPKNVDGHFLLGQTLGQLGEYKAALGSFMTALALSPESPHVHAAISKVWTTLKKWVEAKTWAESALRFGPDEPEAAALLATSLYMLGDREKGVAQLREVVRKHPNRSLIAANNLALFLADEGRDLDFALELANKAASRSGGNTDVVDTLAWVKYRIGDAKGARAILVSLVEAAPKQPNVRYHYGVVLMDMKDPKAAEELKAALDLSCDARYAEDARKRLDALAASRQTPSPPRRVQ